MTRQVHLLGAGRAAVGLARLLPPISWSIGSVVARSAASSRRAAALVGGTASTSAATAFTPDSVTIVGVPDGELSAVLQRLDSLPAHSNSIALHLSGSIPSTALDCLKPAVEAVGGLHPLVSFPSLATLPSSLSGCWFGIEGDPGATAIARQLVRDLGGLPLALESDAKPLYHAAASIAANHLVTLIDQAVRLAKLAGVEPKSAQRAFTELARGALTNAAASDELANALSGPIERGDTGVIEQHLRALTVHSQGDLAYYRAAAIATVELAVRKGAIDDLTARQLRAHLEEGAE